MNICERLEKVDRKSTNRAQPIPQLTTYFQRKIYKKLTKYLLGNTNAIRPKVYTDRFENAYVNKLIF